MEGRKLDKTVWNLSTFHAYVSYHVKVKFSSYLSMAVSFVYFLIIFYQNYFVNLLHKCDWAFGQAVLRRIHAYSNEKTGRITDTGRESFCICLIHNRSYTNFFIEQFLWNTLLFFLVIYVSLVICSGSGLGSGSCQTRHREGKEKCTKQIL